MVGCWGFDLTPPEFGDIVPGMFTPVLAKHTKSFNPVDTLSVASAEATSSLWFSSIEILETECPAEMKDHALIRKTSGGIP